MRLPDISLLSSYVIICVTIIGKSERYEQGAKRIANTRESEYGS